MSDFYVGYSSKAPPRLARFVGRIVGLSLVLAVGAALVCVIAQSPFPASRFEYGVFRDFEGVVQRQPFPMLVTKDAEFLLVAPGKHGFSLPAEGPVKLTGSLIERGRDAMLEVTRVQNVNGVANGDSTPLPEIPLGQVAILGEIVDSKCHLGVMNPGEGKVHRDCATRCISGGIPPALVARDSAGEQQFILLTGPDVLPFVAEPVEVSGSLARIGSKIILHATGIKRVASSIIRVSD